MKSYALVTNVNFYVIAVLRHFKELTEITMQVKQYVLFDTYSYFVIIYMCLLTVVMFMGILVLAVMLLFYYTFTDVKKVLIFYSIILCSCATVKFVFQKWCCFVTFQTFTVQSTYSTCETALNKYGCITVLCVCVYMPHRTLFCQYMFWQRDQYMFWQHGQYMFWQNG